MEPGVRGQELNLQYADHIQCIDKATLPIGVNDGGKEKKKKRKGGS